MLPPHRISDSSKRHVSGRDRQESIGNCDRPSESDKPPRDHECDNPVHGKLKVHAHTWLLEGFALVDTAMNRFGRFWRVARGVEEASGKPWNVGWSCSPLDDRVD